MMDSHDSRRRRFVQLGSLATLGALLPAARATATVGVTGSARPGAPAVVPALSEFNYGDVSLADDGLQEQQRRATHAVLMALDEDSVLKPLRQMSGMRAPGSELGGWYRYNPNYDWRANFDDGFAPACTFGQWVSALARGYAIDRDAATRDKVLRLNRLYAQTISGRFYEDNRFPTYCYDKIVCGLIDSHQYVGDRDAFRILERTTDVALPHLPGRAIEHGVSWRPGTDESFTWDESYTLSENLFIAFQRGAGDRYRTLGRQYLDDEYYGPLAENRSNLAGRHAYSHVNSLSSAMQAYLTLGSERHLHAASNAFDMLVAQSYATGGWGPDETLRAPDSDDVADSLNFTHHSFETPCGSYAHFKLTRYLLRVTGNARYGDSMERVTYNTVLGVKPMLADGSTFYYADCNFEGHKFYHAAKW
ncbi:MAG: beta-L-arabinofuranosidase domain-containing protein, partial [Steroidobacteraceae bacterium]